MAWLPLGGWGLGFGNLLGGIVAVLMATTPLALHFQILEELYRPNAMALWTTFGPQARG